jgi:hypothetical protein
VFYLDSIDHQIEMEGGDILGESREDTPSTSIIENMGEIFGK